MPYLTAEQIEAKMADLERRFSPVCTRFLLTPSVEKREMHGLRIKGKGQLDYRPNVLITAGVHAREWAPPDAVLSFVEELLVAYFANAPITEHAFAYTNRRIAGGGAVTLDYGQYVVSAIDVQNMVNNLVTYVIPMVNPDGRNFSLRVEPWWRKNRQSFSHWQLIKVLGATGGTYTLSFRGATTGAIPFNAGVTDIEQALSLLTTVGPGNVVVMELLPDTECIFVRFTGNVTSPYPLMIADSTRLVGASHSVAIVDWGDGVDINRNFRIAWKKEVYYTVAAEQDVSASATLDDQTAVQDYRGPHL